MPLYKSIPVPKGLLSVWQITETSDELISLLTAEETQDPDFLKFTYEKRKTEWLATRALLRTMIGSPFRIIYTESGKPLLKHPVYQHISISHSRDFVAVLIHQQLSVGIDIESINRHYAPIAKRYLSEVELEQVNESAVLQCIYWCAKEAVFKIVPESEIDFRKQIEVMAFNPEQELFFARFRSGNQERIYQLQHTSFDQHCLVWACSDPE
ncbi:MAG TPA: 4'-phosphopantetheinyl transferase superfamily protein [Prolixibacteraceae bacterium]|jgi:4'-phosphopantetheinyl transferase EntD